MNADWQHFVEQYKQLHESNVGAFEGRSLLPHAWQIMEMIDKHKSQSILDYGCGAGHQYSKFHLERWWGIMPTLYDPGVAAFSKHPEGRQSFDGVIASDVMEHIPESAVALVIEDIIMQARQWVFFSICCREAKRILPNGSNAHVTVRPPEWWLERIKPLARARGLEWRIEWSV